MHAASACRHPHRPRAWLVPLVVGCAALVGSCAHGPPPEASCQGGACDAPLPAGPEVEPELMGYAVVSEAERLLTELVPPAADGSVRLDPGRALGLALGLDAPLAQVLDLTRPAGVALLNPALLANGGVRPFVAMVPVISREAVEQALARRGTIERHPWGLVAQVGSEKVAVGFQRGYAVVAWRRDLLRGTTRLLQPRLMARHEAPLQVSVSVRNLMAAYRPQTDALLAQLALLARRPHGPDEAQLAYALRALRPLVGGLGSVRTLDLLVDLDRVGLTVTARLDGERDGAWARWVGTQRTAPAWGVSFLPEDAVLAYVSGGGPRREDVDVAVDYLAAAVPGHAPSPALTDRWRGALQRSLRTTLGEVAYALWPGERGGIGVGGAYRVRDPLAARAAVLELYDAMSAQMGGVALRALPVDANALASHTRAVRWRAPVGEVSVDVMEVGVAWPEGAAPERRLFEALFGPRLVLATAFVGEQALFAMGADWEARLARMIEAAHGRPGPSLGQSSGFSAALAFHKDGRTALSYVDARRMTKLASSLLSRSRHLDPAQEAALARVLSHLGEGSIVTTTNARGGTFEVTTRIPTGALVGGAELRGALFRVCMAPILNPPMIPPMPVPPPHVVPPTPDPGPSL